MAREATKAAGNIWYQARMRAAKYDDRLCSRDGAAERLGMSTSAIADAELGLGKVMPVEKAIIMADGYNSPELLDYYCKNECPIGRNKPISYNSHEIDRITVKVLKHLELNQLEDVKSKLIDIAEDGEISEEEIEDLNDIVQFFDNLDKTVCELRNLAKRASINHRKE